MPDPATLMECPYCNGENWPDAESCEHCGELIIG